jgi:hypothetical protein
MKPLVNRNQLMAPDELIAGLNQHADELKPHLIDDLLN